MAEYIAGKLVRRSKDVRDAVRLARLCKTEAEVDEFAEELKLKFSVIIKLEHEVGDPDYWLLPAKVNMGNIIKE